MNKREKELLQLQLKAEEDVIHELEKQYKQALKDINQKVKLFEADIQMLDEAINTDGMDEAAKAMLQSQKRSKVYQKQFQEALQGQINGILDRMQGNNYSTIESYLKGCYEDAFIGTMYDIHGQGVPIIMPIDQAAAVKAIMTDSKISKGLYNSLGVDVSGLKKAIRQEITRGIGSGLLYSDIARNIANTAKAPLSRAKTIVRTEGHRIQQQSADDARRGAISRGCDVVRQWDAALDGRTRPSHRRVDGEIRELDEKFSNGLMFPGDPNGGAAEVVNCRCVALTRARWALDEEELKTLQERAEYFGLDKTKNFEEYKEKYLKAAGESEKQWGIPYGEKALNVDFDYINSEAYASKFANITDNQAVNDSLLNVSKTIFEHRSGTNKEDLYLINAEDGSIFAKITTETKIGGINYTKEFEAKLKEAKTNSIPIISIHNHPQGTPPSPDDFRKAFDNGYALSLAVGHNGQVYVYDAPSKNIDESIYKQMNNELGIMFEGGSDVDRACNDVYNYYDLVYRIIEGGG